MSTAIEAIIFDVGGVLIRIADMGLIQQVFSQYLDEEISVEQWKELIEPFSKGHMNEEEATAHICRELGADPGALPQRELFRSATGQFESETAVYEIAHKLRQDGYTMAVLSNSVPPHTQWLRKQGTYDLFDVVVVSDEVGMRKPEPEIYQLTLERLGVDPEEAVFIDDTKENIEAAEKLGIHGILYENPEQLREDLRQLTVKV